VTSQRYPITHFVMVPAITYHMLHNPKLAKLDLSSLAYATAGAAYLPPELRVPLNAEQRTSRSFSKVESSVSISSSRLWQPDRIWTI